LTFRVGGLPPFAHRFYVNATPRIWDINFNNTNTDTPPTDTSGAGWHTMLVGGLGAGGRAVYALDVTAPVSVADIESAVASHVLWEFTDADLGHVFDAPTLVKTYAYGWVVLVASGYNNPGGKGILYVLNPTNGAILQKLSTPVGSDADPSGLSTIRAYTASRKDPYVLQAYGGDLKGNVWRFDLSNADASKWKVELIANLTGPDGTTPQPITTGVRIEIDQNNNVDRYLFIGTGKLLSEADLFDTSVNTLYVIRDGTRTAPDPAPSTPYSRSVLNAVDIGSVAGVSTIAPGSRGWRMDGLAGQKIVADVTADVQAVVAVFSKKSDDPCGVALESTLVARDYATGNSVLESTGGAVVPSITDIGAVAGVRLIQGQGSAVGGVSSGDVRVQVTTMKGQVFSFGVRLSGTPNLRHRVSWRLLNRE
jgi:type IV pilus assembly protein PilY1